MPRTRRQVADPSDFQRWLGAMVDGQEYSMREICRRAGLAETTLERILGDPRGRRPRYDTIVALARAFSIPEAEPLRLAGYAAPGSATEGIHPRLLMYARLASKLPPEDLAIVLTQMQPWAERGMMLEEAEKTAGEGSGSV